MDVHEHIRAEQVFHDRQARRRAAVFQEHPGAYLVVEDDYLDHEPWIRPALANLGDVRGKCVLDYGCGHGMAAVVLAQRGARVTAFDLSGGYLHEAGLRARANHVAIDFVQANGTHLPFANATFDRVWGNAVLHHLDIKQAAAELRRVLKPEGCAVFCEPWGGNPLLNWMRRHLPYPGKERTPNETPLTEADVRALRNTFGHVNVAGYQFFAMAGRVLRKGAILKSLAWCDQRLLTKLPVTQRWCRYVVVTLQHEVISSPSLPTRH